MRVVGGHQPLRWRTWVSDGYDKGQSGERASNTQSCRLLPAMRDPRGTMGMRHQEVGW